MNRLWAMGLLLVLGMTGCGTIQRAKQADVLEAQVKQLQEQHDDLAAQMKLRDDELARLYAEQHRLQAEKQQVVEKVDELAQAKERLARDLRQQIGEYRAKLTMTERGLIITFLAEILFDSGKAVVRPEGHGVLDTVAEVLATTVKDNHVAIEGHTDNEPIRHSGWPSNWELSTHRALAVLHYFVETRGLPPSHFQASGFGEYRPVAMNDTSQGRQQNRRVEIVILPKGLTKVKSS